MTDCQLLELKFKEKFGVYPVITYQVVESYGANFLIWKQGDILGGIKQKYYKIGKTLSWAQWMIDGWKIIPAALVVFESEDDKNKYALSMELLYLKNDREENE